MDKLELPERLKGPWHHALILTYGMDIPFFESALLPHQFYASCRNKIILNDGQRYLKNCETYARNGLARYMNQRYVAEGIYLPYAAHAKIILLTNSERGRLLVGSGNLNLEGYASPGELFTQYDFSREQPEALSAFRAVLDLVEWMLSAGCISDTAAQRLRRLLTETPWLYQNVNRDWRPVRHNLRRSFLDQLVEAVANEPVEELWVLSPFYDESGYALTQMLQRLRPAQTTLLVQRGVTSVNSETLAQVIAAAETSCQVRAFGARNNATNYFHAKLYLLKLPDRAICLQGSPNLSARAMLRVLPEANLEAANLLVGPRDGFDYLFDSLTIEPAALDLHSLDLAYRTDDGRENQAAPLCQLRSGVWHNDQLQLQFQGSLPDLDRIEVNIDGRLFVLPIAAQRPQQITFTLSTETVALLQRPVPVMLQWTEAGQPTTSNPIFVCNRASLDAVIAASGDDRISRVGDLELDDEELEQLVAELDANTVIDQRSLWHVAGRRPPSGKGEDDEGALRLDYADIDYEMLRRHPRLQQYMAFGRSGSSAAQTRLQLILSSITNHFQGLLDVATGEETPTAVTLVEESVAETEAEREEEEAEKQARRWGQAQRLRNIFKQFIKRYLRGIHSRDFQELVGPQVITVNAIIFSHLLWVLFRKDWFQPENRFVIESLLNTWRFFWGSHERTGYLSETESETQHELLREIRHHHADAQLLAALYHCAMLTRMENCPELRFELRDFWRYLLVAEPFPITSELLEETWYWVADLIPFQPPRPTAIVVELSLLAHFETESGFLRTLEVRHNFPSGSCFFERARVRRPGFPDPVTIKCLCLRSDTALADAAAGIAVLQDWMAFERLDYYRLVYPDANAARRLLFYETNGSYAVYWDKDSGDDPVESGAVTPLPPDWTAPVERLQTSASALDKELTIPLARRLTVE